MNKEPKTDSLKNQSENFNEKFTQKKEQIMIDGIQFNKFGDFYVDYDFNNKFQSISSSAKEYKILKSLIEQLTRKTQECEELLKENQQLRNSLSDSLMFKFTSQENETDGYRKALKEIEEYCNNVLSFTAVRTTESDILNIINKAKGEECN